MRILMLTANDPAGTAILFCDAINAHTEHSCRLITTATRYDFNFRTDLHVPTTVQVAPDAPVQHAEPPDPRLVDEAAELMRDADVFHFHILSDEHMSVGPLRPRDFMAGKTIVHHHHGHPDFRGNPEKYQEKYKGLGRANLLVSTPDLLHKLPGATWMPNLVPVDDEAYTPLPGKPLPGQNTSGQNTPLRIMHSPTRKDLKNTDDLQAAVDALRAKGANLELDLVENTPHDQCLARKRSADVLFDHLQGYYGVSSLEGLSQGLAVIAGLDDWCASHIKDFFGVDELPWLCTDVQRLQGLLAALVADPERTAEAGRRSREFMVRHWNPRTVARRLAAFYESRTVAEPA